MEPQRQQVHCVTAASAVVNFLHPNAVHQKGFVADDSGA